MTNGSKFLALAALAVSCALGATVVGPFSTHGPGAASEPVVQADSIAPPAPDDAVPLAIDEVFVPSGMMGDAATPGSLLFQPNHRGDPHSGPSCIKLVYRPSAQRWAAVAWQYPENNWGEIPGRDLSRRGFSCVSVFARGVPGPDGRLPVIQLKAGGGTDPALPHMASFAVAGEFVTLSEEWQEYTLPLPPQPAALSNVPSALTVVLRAQDQPRGGATFFLDTLTYR